LVKRIAAAAAIALGLAALVIWATNLGPHGDPKPSVTDWISAVGQAVGALGTAGALWLGAITFQRQVRDQHRAQASAITVSVEKSRHDAGILEFKVKNDSNLPIYEVLLFAVDRQGNNVEQDFRTVLSSGDSLSFQLRTGGDLMRCRAYFRDSSGTRWSSEASGQLVDVTTKRNG
jgi:hypothetical protein